MISQTRAFLGIVSQPKARAREIGPAGQRVERVGSPVGVGRNDACPCRSGRKFKNCCLVKLKRSTRQDS